jgi:nitrate/nitrite transporter NarK
VFRLKRREPFHKICVRARFSNVFFGSSPAERRRAGQRALGTVAGLVGLGGAMGGVVLGQTAGYLLDHGFSYTPVLIIAGSLHVIAFGIICLAIPSIRPCSISNQL